MKRQVSRRSLLKGLAIGGAGTMMAACQPKVVEVTSVVEKVVEKVVKETVMVEGTPQVVEKVVKETVIVEPEVAPEEPTEISFEHFFANPELWDFAFKPIFEYIEEEANVKMVHINVPYGDMMTKLLTMIAGGTPPDLTSLSSTATADIASKGVLLPLDERVAVDPPCPLDDLMPSRMEDSTVNGKLFAMPIDQGSDAVFYNKEIFDKEGLPYPTADWTWDDLIELAQFLTVDGTGKRATDPGFDPDNIVQWGYKSTNDAHRGYNIAASYGGDKMWFDKDVTKCRMDEPGVVEGLQFLVDLRCRYHVAPTATQQTTIGDAASGLQPFSLGYYAMEDTWVGLCSHMAREGVTVQDWDVVFRPKGKATTATSGGQGFPIIKDSQNHDKAWEVIKLFYTEEVMKMLGQGGAWMPARISYAHWGRAEGGIPEHYVDAFVTPVAEYGFHKPWYLPGWLEWRRVIQSGLEPCWLCDATAEEAVNGFIDEVNDMVAEREIIDI